MLNGKRNEEIFYDFVENKWNDVFDKLNKDLEEEDFNLEAGETGEAIYLDYIGVFGEEIVEATIAIDYNGDYSKKSLCAHCSARLDSLGEDYEIRQRYEFNGNEKADYIAKKIAETVLICSESAIEIYTIGI